MSAISLSSKEEYQQPNVVVETMYRRHQDLDMAIANITNATLSFNLENTQAEPSKDGQAPGYEVRSISSVANQAIKIEKAAPRNQTQPLDASRSPLFQHSTATSATYNYAATDLPRQIETRPAPVEPSAQSAPEQPVMTEVDPASTDNQSLDIEAIRQIIDREAA